jgi:hypothetical protein
MTVEEESWRSTPAGGLGWCCSSGGGTTKSMSTPSIGDIGFERVGGAESAVAVTSLPWKAEAFALELPDSETVLSRSLGLGPESRPDEG